jgi:hypothetical protein
MRWTSSVKVTDGFQPSLAMARVILKGGEGFVRLGGFVVEGMLLPPKMFLNLIDLEIGSKSSLSRLVSLEKFDRV